MPRDLRTTLMEWNAARAQREAHIRRIDMDLDWRTWARRRLAAYWYGLLAAFADVALIATIISAFPRPSPALAYAAALAFVVPVTYFEWELYRYLWPRDDELLEAAVQASDEGALPTARRVPKPRRAPADADPPPATEPEASDSDTHADAGESSAGGPAEAPDPTEGAREPPPDAG